MGVNRTSKMLAYVNYGMRVTILDGRQIVGRFMAFDRHMNLVLADAEEFRKLPPKKGLSEEDRHTRRVLGFLLLRGEEVVSLTVEGPPPQEDKRAQQAPAGPGSGRAAGRGMPGGVPGMPPPGLAGPAHGVGGPAAAAMRPQFAGAPVMRPPPGVVPGMPPPGFRPGMPPPGAMPPGFRPGMPPPGMPPPASDRGLPGPRRPETREASGEDESSDASDAERGVVCYRDDDDARDETRRICETRRISRRFDRTSNVHSRASRAPSSPRARVRRRDERDYRDENARRGRARRSRRRRRSGRGQG